MNILPHDMLEFLQPGCTYSLDYHFLESRHSLPCAPYIFQCIFMSQSAGKFSREALKNFDLALEPLYDACLNTSNPSGPYMINTRIIKKDTTLRIKFWLGTVIGACL